MGTVNVVLGEDTRLNLILGQQLENAVTSVVFDFSAWQTTYGSGTLALSVQRPGDDQPYAVTMTTSGTDATWSVTNLDTAYKGVGHIQLTYTVGSAIKKSVVYKFTVYESLGANGEYPSPGQTWQEGIEDDIEGLRTDVDVDHDELIDIREGADGVTYPSAGDAVRGQITDVKADLSKLESSIFDTIENGVDVKDISGITKKAETSAIAYSSSTMTAVSFSTATSYDSYWFEVTKDCEIYTNVGTTPYYAIVHGEGFIGVDINTGWLKCESATRYRNSDNNLPTESNKLSVSRGDVLAFTFPKNTSNVVYGLDSSFVVKDSFAKSVDEKIEQIDKPTVSIETGLITITAKKVKYYIRHIVDDSVNVDCWRVYKGSLLNDGAEYVMWNGSDADGVIKLLNESDFLGGFHGDEITTKVSLIIDGTEVGLSTSLETAFSSLSLFAESDIYHCNTSEDAGIVCFKRNKIIEFDDDTLSVKNNFTAVKDVSVVYAHLAMLSCARSQDGTDIINSYTDNYDYKLHSNTDTIDSNSRLNKCSVNTNCGLLVFEANKGSAQQYKGMVVSYDGTGVNNRLKWYFSAINESSASPIQLSNGDEIYGEYTLSVI